MKEIAATITSKGQVTVPVEIRRALGLRQGDKVVFQLEGREVRLATSSSRLAAGYRSIPALAPSRSWQEVEELVADEQAERFAARDGTATR